MAFAITFGDWLSEIENWVYAVLALIMVYSAPRVVTSRNVVHAALFLVITLGGSAAMFLLLASEFVAWTVVLVYLGAVIILILFGVMITRAPLGFETRLSHPLRVRIGAALAEVDLDTALTVYRDRFADAPLRYRRAGSGYLPQHGSAHPA